MSIIIVTFQNAPEISEAALSKEKELDVLLEEKVKGENFMLTFPLTLCDVFHASYMCQLYFLILINSRAV